MELVNSVLMNHVWFSHQLAEVQGFFTVLCFFYFCVLPTYSSFFFQIHNYFWNPSTIKLRMYYSVLYCTVKLLSSQDMLRPHKPFLQCDSFFGFLTSQDEVISCHSLPKATLGLTPEDMTKCRIGLWVFGLFCTHLQGHCSDFRSVKTNFRL